MIIVTGGAGFIGSNLINHLLRSNKSRIVSVDWHNRFNENYFSDKGFEKVNPGKIFELLKKRKKEISIVIHLGAITSTTEQNLDLIIKNNIDLSLMLWDWCKSNNKRLIYASSAATYGDGDKGFSDEKKYGIDFWFLWGSLGCGVGGGGFGFGVGVRVRGWG